jgi:thiol-disulfide isomerase/thioredoxin
MADEPIPEGPSRGTRAWWYVASGFVIFWAIYVTFFGPRRRALLENTGMSQPAEYNWSVHDLDDRPVAFSQFKGKPVFLNIWATWCGPCVHEMPSIARLAENPRLKGKDIQFVCLSTDDSSAAVRRFIEGKNWTMTFLRADRLPSVFSTEGIPATFMIAADGRIAASEIGSADWSEPHVVEFLEKLASSPAAAR